ncbi:MAG: hypothetical protein MR006_05220, partial [Arcanobacterium sp.]|nr:hypothetical protein [Arcanobacterium sp.]
MSQKINEYFGRCYTASCECDIAGLSEHKLAPHRLYLALLMSYLGAGGALSTRRHLSSEDF